MEIFFTNLITNLLTNSLQFVLQLFVRNMVSLKKNKNDIIKQVGFINSIFYSPSKNIYADIEKITNNELEKTIIYCLLSLKRFNKHPNIMIDIQNMRKCFNNLRYVNAVKNNQLLEFYCIDFTNILDDIFKKYSWM